jgi:leader peptidase (prepilin peptidase)/N-methyltransferase
MLVELANALFYVAIFVRMGVSPGFLLVAGFASMTIVLIFIDADVGFLPHVVTIPGIVTGIAVGLFRLGTFYPGLFLSERWLDSVAGALVGYALIWSLSRLYKAIRGMEGMGGGDSMMLAMVGAAMGWKAVLPVLFLSSFIGTFFGLAEAWRSRRGMQAAIPYGIFLGLAVFVLLFFGTTLAGWYVGLVAP